MKAVRYDRFGSPDVLELREVEPPVVGDDKVLVQVRAASANRRDWHFMRGSRYLARMSMGVRKPKYVGLGSNVAGQVEAVGRSATRFRVGDEVIADVVAGGFAEYVSVGQDFVVKKPENATFEEAAAVPLAGVTALQGVRDAGRVKSGHKALIAGASGGVCSTKNVELVKSLGADKVIDYTKQDFTKGGPSYDLVFQLAGTLSPLECSRALTEHGTLLSSRGESKGHWIGPMGRPLQALALSPFVSQRLVPFLAKRNTKDLETLKDLIESGTVKPVIDRTYPLERVQEAMRYLEDGHHRGK